MILIVICIKLPIFKNYILLNDNEILLNFRSIQLILRLTLYNFLNSYFWPDDGTKTGAEKCLK